jgi:hypothetical protein
MSETMKSPSYFVLISQQPRPADMLDLFFALKIPTATPVRCTKRAQDQMKLHLIVITVDDSDLVLSLEWKAR